MQRDQAVARYLCLIRTCGIAKIHPAFAVRRLLPPVHRAALKHRPPGIRYGRLRPVRTVKMQPGNPDMAQPLLFILLSRKNKGEPGFRSFRGCHHIDYPPCISPEGKASVQLLIAVLLPYLFPHDTVILQRDLLRYPFYFFILPPDKRRFSNPYFYLPLLFPGKQQGGRITRLRPQPGREAKLPYRVNAARNALRQLLALLPVELLKPLSEDILLLTVTLADAIPAGHHVKQSPAALQNLPFSLRKTLLRPQTHILLSEPFHSLLKPVMTVYPSLIKKRGRHGKSVAGEQKPVLSPRMHKFPVMRKRDILA